MRVMLCIFLVYAAIASSSSPLQRRPSTPIKRENSYNDLQDIEHAQRVEMLKTLKESEKKIDFLNQRIRDISIESAHNQIVLNYLHLQMKDAITLQRELQMRRSLVLRHWNSPGDFNITLCWLAWTVI